MSTVCDQVRGGAETIEVARYQPMMVVSDGRLECDCGLLAIYLLISFSSDSQECATALYCQDCYEREQEACSGL